jgi:hypothetical protein
MLVRRSTALIAALTLSLGPIASAQPKAKAPPDPARLYDKMVAKVANMVEDQRAASIASGYNLSLLNVLWEDTGRYEGSSVGPNISDVTIEVEGYSSGKTHHSYLMPVMRHDNYVDRTADVKMDRILIPVGNQAKNGQLELVSLTELLQDPTKYMSLPNKGKIKSGKLWAKRDTHVLVSAQHAFLPVPKEGQAKFWPVIFNYQSTKKNPAVLTILVTRQGTSMTIIDNDRDTLGGDSWGQRLYFNNAGERAPLIAERLADVKAAGVTANGESAQNLGDDSNVLMLIQVPLKYREPQRMAMPMKAAANDMSGAGLAAPAASPPAQAQRSAGSGERDRSDVDVAVLGHGASEGPYTELDGLTIARDARFPVRVTLQFYQATSNGVISKDNVKAMAAQIRKVYGKGDFVGSLVVPSGMDRVRPTNWTGVTTAGNVTRMDFPGLVERFSKGMWMGPYLGAGVR